MEWIRVLDKAPPISEEILTYCPYHKYCSCVTAAYYDGEDFWFDCEGSPAMCITHWLPLPKPPISLAEDASQ